MQLQGAREGRGRFSHLPQLKHDPDCVSVTPDGVIDPSLMPSPTLAQNTMSPAGQISSPTAGIPQQLAMQNATNIASAATPGLSGFLAEQQQ